MKKMMLTGLFLLISSVAWAETKVQYLITCCNPGTNQNIKEIGTFKFFDVVVWVRGTPGSPGIFAAFCDVEFDGSMVWQNFAHPGAFSFKEPYTNGKQLFASPDNKGIIRSGAFAGLNPVGAAMEVYRFRLRADKPANLTFKASLNRCTSPVDDTLIYGMNERVDPSEIFLGSASIVVK